MKTVQKPQNHAFTLAELMISLIVSITIFFIIMTIFGIGKSSYEKINQESQLYNDILYGFELMKNSVRKASTSVTIENWANPPWKSQILVVDNRAFGLYQANSNAVQDFVYLADKSNINNRKVILSNANPINWIFTANGSLITIQTNGKKNKESFDLTTAVCKRN